ncbi:MAG TPA: YjgN family protein [Gemmatimonadaceae bacterium]|nr:YjgN family protein [Gemmatimonadaceae bacterium]
MSTRTAQLRYHGTGGSLFGLFIVNGLLTMITLGIYSFWAKTRLREFHYSHTELDGDRFAYHGTGGELLVGSLKAFGIIMVLVIGLVAVSALLAPGSGGEGMQLVVSIGFYVVIMLLAILAVNGARRYRLSRSSWRGIRFSFHGQYGEFLGLMVRGTLLSVVTLGFWFPLFQNQRRRFLVENARFGSEPFLYDGDGKALVPEFLKAVLLTIPTLGLYWCWYAAFKHRYFWEHTAMRGARFRSTVQGGPLLALTLTNLLLVIFTLGLGAAWAITRAQAFWCDSISMYGTVDWASIQQRAQDVSATAEGLADGFDIDVGIG